MSLGPKTNAEAVIYAEENLRVDLQHRLQKLLNYRKLTRRQLAARVGMTEASVSRLFSGAANPRLDTIARLFHALDDECIITSKQLEKLSGRAVELVGWTRVEAAAEPSPVATALFEDSPPSVGGQVQAA